MKSFEPTSHSMKYPVFQLSRLFLPALIAALLLSVPCADAQTSIGQHWEYINRSDSGIIYYLEKSFLKTRGALRHVWQKNVFPDGSYQLISTGWQCANRQFRILEAGNYDADGTFTDHESASPWTNIFPDSVSEEIFAAVCGNYSSEEKPEGNSHPTNRQAEVIVRQANVRDAPRSDGRIIGRAVGGERLTLGDAPPVRGWYQIRLNGNPAETGWLNGGTIKIILAPKLKNDGKPGGKKPSGKTSSGKNSLAPRRKP